jgi:hypothetical protein
MPTDSDRRQRLAQMGRSADETASMLEHNAKTHWRQSGDEFRWGVAFEVINLRRFAAWALKASGWDY